MFLTFRPGYWAQPHRQFRDSAPSSFRAANGTVGYVATPPANRASFNHRIHELRGVAVLGVVAYHVAPSLLPGGFSGVDVFFVISGYLITFWFCERLHLRPGDILVLFWKRRVRRLFPALAAMIGGIYLLAVFVLQPVELRFLGKHGFAALLGSANITLWTESGYFDSEVERKPFLHLWSLGVEEQFYFFWPLLLLLATFFAIRLRFEILLLIWILTFALLLLSFFLSLELSMSSPATAFYLPATRGWELLSGSLLAVSAKLWPARPAKLAGRGLIVSGYGGIIGGYFLIQPTMAIPGTVMVLPVLSTCFLIFGSNLDTRSTAAKQPWLAPIWMLGEVSYPLYLWHWPLLVLGSLTFGSSNYRIMEPLAIALALGFAMVSHLYVEKQFRSNRTKDGGHYS